MLRHSQQKLSFLGLFRTPQYLVMEATKETNEVEVSDLNIFQFQTRDTFQTQLLQYLLFLQNSPQMLQATHARLIWLSQHHLRARAHTAVCENLSGHL